MLEKNLTKEIFSTDCPYSNPFQGPDKRILFVCSAGLLRSATAANLFAKSNYNTRSCGSEEYALIPISANLINWADKIFFMQERNLRTTLETFKDHSSILDLLEKKTIVLDIPDSFEYNDPKLIKLLTKNVT